MNNGTRILAQLEAVINDRKLNPTPNSYTAKLLDGGADPIGAKIREEAAELVQAAQHLQKEQGDRTSKHVVHEAADLVYHLLVMLSHCNVTLDEVEAELARRFGTSGLDEKSSRTS